MTTEEIMIEHIDNYQWNPSFPFEVMTDLPIARGTIEALYDTNYQKEVYEAHGLVLFLNRDGDTYFCLPSVLKQIKLELTQQKGITI